MNKNCHIRVLLVEGNRGKTLRFAKELEKRGCHLLKAQNGTNGLELLSIEKPDVIVIDAASLRTSGSRICTSFKSAQPDIPLILIIGEDIHLNGKVDANIVLQMPFTIQKLINRLKRYNPVKDKNILHSGPLHLNLSTNILICNNLETKLTPRMASVLKNLMENPGKILDRKELFKKVWETDYLGDTRTLDVHISWLRKCIEVDPHQPVLLKTIRASGYKLDI